MKPGIDEHPLAVIRFNQRPGNANDPSIGMHLEQAVVHDVEPGDGTVLKAFDRQGPSRGLSLNK
jgi:hypothetical protein